MISDSLHHVDADVRWAAVRALARQLVDDSTPALLAALRDDDWGVRHDAARALARCPGPEVTQALISAYMTEHEPPSWQQARRDRGRSRMSWDLLNVDSPNSATRSWPGAGS
jgi:HEAT repeat protein